ncbi:hypothetical protein HPP92_028999, partial [Vanilla planifolia]
MARWLRHELRVVTAAERMTCGKSGGCWMGGEGRAQWQDGQEALQKGEEWVTPGDTRLWTGDASIGRKDLPD